MRTILFASACVLICSTAAIADDFTGALNVGYAAVTGDDTGNVWIINGTGQVMLGNTWGLEGNASYDHTTPGSLDGFSFGASPFYKFSSGRIAATVAYGGIDTEHWTQYSAGGDWFVTPDMTLSLRGGGFSMWESDKFGTSSSWDSGYIGGQGTWYPLPNLALTGAIDYFSGFHSHDTIGTLKAEWQFSNDLPLAIYGGYAHDTETVPFITGTIDTDILIVGLKFYFDGGNSLVDHQRTGSLGYITQSTWSAF